MLRAASFFLALSVLAVASAQTGAASAQQGAAPASALPTQTKPSELVAPALDNVAKAGSAVDLNKWKGSSAVKQDVDGNLASIQKDLNGTLPSLLKAADGAPSSVSASIPVLLNMDALYNVLLRVSISGKGNAPRDQQDSIDGALSALDGARRDLGQRIVRMASAQEKQISTLQASVQQQAATITTMQQAAAPPPPAAKPKKKAAPKPSATSTTAPAK